MTFGSAGGPAFRKQAQPVYPSLARRRSKEGVVLLRLSINENGNLTHIELIEDPGHGFAEAAIEAVRSSSFSPAHYNGKPVAIQATLPIRFTLR
jgi:protein TonB